MSDDRKVALLLLVGGLAFCAAAPVMIARRRAETIPPTPIRSCGYYRRGANVIIAGGREIRIEASCPSGGVIEKRRGELTYRVDGKPLAEWVSAMGYEILMLAIGIALLIVGGILLRSTRGES